MGRGSSVQYNVRRIVARAVPLPRAFREVLRIRGEPVNGAAPREIVEARAETATIEAEFSSAFVENKRVVN